MVWAAGSQKAPLRNRWGLYSFNRPVGVFNPMANYSYITLKRRINEAIFVQDVSKAILDCLDDRWKLTKTEFDDDGPVWSVTLPGTAVYENAGKVLKAPGEDVGFPIALQDRKVIAFRGSINMFESWAQGRLKEQLADYYQVGVFSDATDKMTPPGTCVYRQGKTFDDYLTRNLDKPLNEDDLRWLERFKRLVPAGHC